MRFAFIKGSLLPQFKLCDCCRVLKVSASGLHPIAPNPMNCPYCPYCSFFGMSVCGSLRLSAEKPEKERDCLYDSDSAG